MPHAEIGLDLPDSFREEVENVQMLTYCTQNTVQDDGPKNAKFSYIPKAITQVKMGKSTPNSYLTCNSSI